MKKLVLSSLVLLSVSLFGQEIIENPKEPLSQKAGRVVELKEIMRITDEGQEDYYFQWTTEPKIAPNGSIFVKARDQFLQFDRKGKFIRNLFKKGQGPKEMLFMGDYSLQEDRFIVFCDTPSKIMWFDYNGKVTKELSLKESTRWLKYQAYYGDQYYFIETEPPLPEKKESIIEVKHTVSSMPANDQTRSSHMGLTTRWYIVLGEKGGRVRWEISSVISFPSLERYLFISHTSEYMVRIFDMKTNKMLIQFNRDYPRVKEAKKDRVGGAFIDGKTVQKPAQKYKNDIIALHTMGDKLWVVTSTQDKKKGRLIDVFDLNGRFVDMFYLKFPEGASSNTLTNRNTTISNNYLYVVERNDDDLVSIVKYKIDG